MSPPGWVAKDSNVLLPVTVPKTLDILLSIAVGLPIAGGLPNAGGDAVAPNAAVPNASPKIGFVEPKVGADPNTGLVPNAGACPKAGCAPSTGCSMPIGEALAPNIDVDPGDAAPGAALGAPPPKKDVDPVFGVPSNIDPDF